MTSKSVQYPILFACAGIFGSHLSAQATCNHTGRQVAVAAGDHNFTSAQCAAFSVSVAGVTLSGPAQCTHGGAHYAGTVYTCQGTANLIHCTTNGFKVGVTTYSDGGCPDLIGLIPGASFASWAKVPSSVRAALKCVPPKKKQTFDWSASAANCATGAKQSPSVGQLNQGAGGAYYIVAQGPAYGIYGNANPFLTGYEVAQAGSPAVVQGALGSLIVPLHGRLLGLALNATVTIEHILGGEAESHTLTVAGAVLANGRFDLHSSCSVVAEGKPFAYGRAITFDGNALTSVWDNAENGNMWDASETNFSARVVREVAEVVPLHAWVWDPLGIPWFSDVEYAEASQGSTLWVRQNFAPSHGGGIDKEYQIDTSGPVPHPVATRIFDCMGGLREETTYGDFKAIIPGTWRPFKTVKTIYLAPGTNQDRIVVTLNVAKATVLTEDEQAAVPATCADSQVWFHWL